MNKEIARSYGLTQRSILTNRKEKNQQIFSLLLPYLEEVESIGIYLSLEEEVDTWEMIQWCLENHKVVAVPKIIDKHIHMIQIDSLENLIEGKFGILEPSGGEEIEISDIDLMIVPMTAFDDKCHRIGFGKGYYDAILSSSKKKIGLAYACQKVDEIEVDDWDIDMDIVITEEGIHSK